MKDRTIDSSEFPQRKNLLTRRSILGTLIASGFGVPSAFAQEYPTQPVRLITPFQAGTIGDTLARIVSKGLSTKLSKPVVVDNRVGAGGLIGTAAVANANPDGYTLLLGSSGTIAVNPFLYDKLPYDAAKGFSPITQLASLYSMLVVHPSVAAKSVSELIALAKANPGKLTFGSGGVGTTPHLAGELFNSLAGVKIEHVPYKGSAQSALDLLEGRISMIFANVPSVLPHIKAGKLRALAVSTTHRVAEFPEIPTISESGLPGYASELWLGMFAPVGTPTQIVERLSQQIRSVMADDEIVRSNAAQGVIIKTNSPAAFATYVKEETVKWEKVVKVSGAKAE